jgi:hypothetical protein
MKKTLLTLALVATSVAAFAQGKVLFGNDSVHLFVIGNSLPADAAFGGGNTTNTSAGAIPASLPSGVVLVAGLYAGTSSSSLALQSTTTILNGTGLPQPGRMANRNTILTIPGTVTQFFQIAIWDSAVLSPDLSQTYRGYSPIFTAIPGTSVTYPSLLPGGPSASTWVAANLVVNAVPEPSSFALAGLGMASLLIFRRRK